MARSPLFDLYDPTGSLGAERIEDLMPEEEKSSLLRSLANMGASGLSGFGYLLDTPGAIVRGILAGDPLSGFGDSERRVTGRELLRQYGLAGEEDTWANFGGGLAAEILLDPLTYASLGLSAVLGRGAKTAARKAAFRAGILPEDIVLAADRANFAGPASYLRNTTPRNLIDNITDIAERDAAEAAWKAFAGEGADELLTQPLARSHRVSLPLLGDDARDLFGEEFGNWAAATSDRLRAGARGAPVIGPALLSAQAMFDARVKGFDDEAGQMMGRRMTESERAARRAADVELSEIVVDTARDIGEDVFRSEAFHQATRNWLERQYDLIPQDMLDVLSTPPGRAWLRFLRRRLTAEAAMHRDGGLNFVSDALPNRIGYGPRQLIGIDNPTIASGYAERVMRPPRGKAIADLSQGGWSRRENYTRAFPTWILDKMNMDGALQDALRNAPASGPDNVRQIIDDWLLGNATFTRRDGTAGVWDYADNPFGFLFDGVDPADLAGQALAARQVRKAYTDLADSLRRTPLEASRRQLPKFGSSINDFATYIRSMGQRRSTADTLLSELARPENIINEAAELMPGGTTYSPIQALEALGGFSTTPNQSGAVRALEILAARAGIPYDDLANISFDKGMIDAYTQKLWSARAPRESRGLMKVIDDVTDSFKTLALASVSRHSRDLYSGGFAAATQGAYNPFDRFAGAAAAGGDYRNLAARLKGTPFYQRVKEQAAANPSMLAELRLAPRWRAASDDDLVDELVLRRYLKDGGGYGLTSQSVLDESGRQAENLTTRELYPGGAGSLFAKVFDKDYTDWRTYSPFSTRGRGGNPNPLLDLSDRVASWTDAANRGGTFLNLMRKGYSPDAAKRVTDLTQVVYSPEAYTEFERKFLTRLFPFYRFTRGITPLIAKELTERPAGLMGQSIRTVNRLGEPSEDRFVPEYLRQSAAIPLDADIPGVSISTPGVSRFLTNIDLPQEGVLNLLSPGVGNTMSSRFLDAIQKTGSNILGQANPLLKGPLEMTLNRQFYSGRQLSDLYSILEQGMGPIGRTLEQVLVNAPGGSRALGLYRNYLDDRISPQEKLAKFAINALTGVKVQDVDQDRTVRLAARETLNELLDSAPGISTFENIYAKPEDLVKLSPQEQQQYLLYRVLQSEAARKRRERQQGLDPMAALGVR